MPTGRFWVKRFGSVTLSQTCFGRMGRSAPGSMSKVGHGSRQVNVTVDGSTTAERSMYGRSFTWWEYRPCSVLKK